MEITKRIFATILFMTFGLLVLQAQRTGQRPEMNPDKMAERQTAMMTEKLALDAAQAEKVKAINLKYAQQHADKKAEAKEGRKAAHQDVHQARMAELKKVLTPDQYKTLEQSQADQKERLEAKRDKGGRRGAGNGANRPAPEERAEKMTDKMVEALGLNAKQAKALEEVNLDFAKKREALSAEKSKKNNADKDAMKQLREEQKRAIEKILTPEQLKKWEEIKSEKGGHKGKGKGRNDGRM